LKVLFDHNVPKRFRREIFGHEVSTTREMGWSTLAHGVLLKAAAQGGFGAFMSIDKKLEHEQNLKLLPLPVIVIDSVSNTLPAVLPFAPAILELL
jgi:hypothetical protein